MKKTLIIGATPNESRYAFKAAEMLAQAEHAIIPFGIKKGEVLGQEIINEWTSFEGVDTVTMYVGEARQSEYLRKIISLNPKRVIFNPGTENPDFYKSLDEAGIQYEEACTLVLLRTNQY